MSEKPEERIVIDGWVYTLAGRDEPGSDEIQLKSLVGLKTLDAVDFSNERRLRYDEWTDSSVCRFRLDGKVYIAIEDPNDGYRSSLASLAQYTSEVRLENTFPGARVLVRHKSTNEHGQEADMLEFLDVETGLSVLEVGTNNSDDYYPSFVASFHPENMAANTALQREGKTR